MEARPGCGRVPMACQRRAWARQADGSGRDTQADRQSRALRVWQQWVAVVVVVVGHGLRG